MKQRISQAKLQRYHRALSALIGVIHDARVRFEDCANMRPGRLQGTARFAKELAGLPHTTDYRQFEVQLKRRLVRAQHRVYGIPSKGDESRFSLDKTLPGIYRGILFQYEDAATELLKSLADVDIVRNHQPLKSVKEVLWPNYEEYGA